MRGIFILIYLIYVTALKAQETRVIEIPQSNETIEFVLIPAGSFELGSTSKKADSDEQPVKTVNLPAFWMAKTELPYQIFQIYQDPELDLDEAGNPRVDAITRPSPPYEDPTHGMAARNHPAAGMTQLAALQFCRWLSDKTGVFIRLPSEVEWEYACEGSSASSDYYFGKKKKELKMHAWFDKTSGGSTHPIASLLPNPFGLYDMYGNVSEWTLDQYQADAYGHLDTEAHLIWIAPTTLHPRSVRGCHFKHTAEDCRSSNRIESNMDWKKRDPQIPKSFWWNTDSPFVGFRVMMPAEETTQQEQSTFWAQVLGG